MRRNPGSLTGGEAKRSEGSSSALEGSEANEASPLSLVPVKHSLVQQEDKTNTTQHTPYYSTSTIHIEVRLLPRLSEYRISS